MVVVLDLSQQGDGALSVERIKLRHVQIVDEVDECVLANGAVTCATLLLELSHEVRAERRRISVVIHVDGLRQVVIGLIDEVPQQALDDLCLTATGCTDEQGAVANGHELAHEVLRRDSVHCRNGVRLDGLARINGVHDV
jgi:hypothetical protein